MFKLKEKIKPNENENDDDAMIGKLLYIELQRILGDIDDDDFEMEELGILIREREKIGNNNNYDNVVKYAFDHAELNTLGIAFWATPLIYKYAFSHMMAMTNDNDNNNDNNNNNNNNHDNNTSNIFIIARSNEIMLVTRALLLINPDCATAWNFRKRFILCQLNRNNNDVQTATNYGKKELALLNFIFSKHHKSGESWAHRRWVLDNLFIKQSRQQQSAKFNIFEEIKICQKVAERYPKNYHAWSHRLWLLKSFIHHDAKLLATEINVIHQWTRSHISDNSGFHYLQKCIEFSLKMNDNGSIDANQSIISRECTHLHDLITRFPGHEAVWCHRRFLFTISAKLLAFQSSNSSSSSDSASLHYRFFFLLNNDERKDRLEELSGSQSCDTHYLTPKFFHLDSELQFVNDILSTASAKNPDRQFAMAHAAWILYPAEKSEKYLELLSHLSIAQHPKYLLKQIHQ